jgi:type I restriction enzyme S subunit
MIAGRHIKNGTIIWGMVDHIPKWRYEESPEIMLKNGDVIFSKDGSLGNPVLISNLQTRATINSTMMLVRTDNCINSNYFFQVMTGQLFKKLIYLKVSGSSIPHLFQADMNTFEFSSPHIQEQEKIAKILDIVDKTIIFHQNKLEKLTKLKKAYLQKLFV